jgi:predicted TIM-barrel fold metal-dependent hydrolase
VAFLLPGVDRSRREEEQRPFVDTHVHFWDRRHPSLRYNWLEEDGAHHLMGDLEAIRTVRYDVDDFLSETRFHAVAKVVHVQAATGSPDPVDETRWLQGLADRTGYPHGIVGYVPLAHPAATEMLDRHAQYLNFRGVRDVHARGADFLSAAWQRSFAALGQRGLVCCLDLRCEDMAAASEVAAQFPDVVLCVDHTGFPVRQDPDFLTRWQDGLTRLASLPNTVMKISGFGVFDPAWTPATIRPLVLTAIDLFGPERSFFGTNWPVDRRSASYGDVLAAYDEVTSDFHPDERSALFAGNAEHIFRI